MPLYIIIQCSFSVQSLYVGNGGRAHELGKAGNWENLKHTEITSNTKEFNLSTLYHN